MGEGTYEEGVRQGKAEAAEAMVKLLRDRIDAVRSRLDHGKGTWPEPGYIQDEKWAGWLAEWRELCDLVRAVESSGWLKRGPGD